MPSSPLLEGAIDRLLHPFGSIVQRLFRGLQVVERGIKLRLEDRVHFLNHGAFRILNAVLREGLAQQDVRRVVHGVERGLCRQAGRHLTGSCPVDLMIADPAEDRLDGLTLLAGAADRKHEHMLTKPRTFSGPH